MYFIESQSLQVEILIFFAKINNIFYIINCLGYVKAYVAKCLIETAIIISKGCVATIHQRIVCLHGGFRGDFPFTKCRFHACIFAVIYWIILDLCRIARILLLFKRFLKTELKPYIQPLVI